MERICVAIRVKPPSRQELSNGNQWKVVDNTISLFSPIGTPIKGQTYSFDTVFGTGARNADIYDEHAKDVVLSAVSGFNGTVFAYGQTSSGKTYTMQGSGADPGVTRLAIRDVFTNIEKIENREFLIRVSYMEIYNEEINDLLAPENRKLRIHENLERGIFVAGLREEIVDSVEQVIAVLERGEAQRHFGETNMNVNSSRSHTIFRMVIESRDKSHDAHQESDPTVQDAVRVSALNMVDLAGSERISKTGAGGARLKEGAHINKSLTTLGIVINKLSDGGGKQGAHVPYRDSKLTRILQSALGGNAKTAIICTINPDEIHIDETRGTLQFASRAKRVTNCAQVNEILTDAALLKRQTREIEDLRRRLQGSPHSEDLEKEILHLRNDLLKFELERERLELELQEEKKAQVERERRIKEQEQRIENLSTMVISGVMEDRELPSKKKLTTAIYRSNTWVLCDKPKSNRRETWCPRKVHSDVVDQGFRRITPEKDDFSFAGSLDNSLQPLASRRDRTFGLPPAFETLIDDESDTFWSNSSGVENSPALSDFGNIADEDTWASLNKDPAAFANVADEDTWASLNEGHVDVDGRFSANSLSDNGIRQASRQAQSFAVAEEGSKITMLEEQVRDLKLQYKELQISNELKIQQETKGVVEAANKTMQQLKSVLEEKSKLEEALARHNLPKRPTRSSSTDEALYKKKQEDKVKNLEFELENCKQENIFLQAETEKLRDQLLHTKTALEQGVQERVSMDEENKFFRERLHSLEMGIQDDFHQSSDRTFYVGGDKLEPTHLCSLCCSSREKNVGEPSMEGEAVDQESPTRYSLTYPQVAEKFEIPAANGHKRRLFEDTEDNYKDQSLKGNDGIVAAMNRLCCRIKQLGGSAAPMDLNKKEPNGIPQSKNLKLSLTLANRLATQLLEELHSIVNHDFRCLDSHVSAKGAVRQSLEALQVLLLENADAALCLLYQTWSEEPSVTNQKLQELSQEVSRVGAQKTEVKFGAYKHKGGQEANPVEGKEVELEGGGKNGPNFLSKHGKVSGAANEDIRNSNIENGPSEKINLLATEEGAGFIETLKMSGQHISTLDYELGIQNLEKEKLSKVLLEQLNVNQESIKAMKAEKLQLARDLESYMGALAMHDEVVAAICNEIKEFEKENATKRAAPIQATLDKDVYQQLQKQETSNLTERYVYNHSTQEVEKDLQQMLGQNIRACTHSKQHLLMKSPSLLERDNLILETALSATRAKLKAAEEDIVQLRRDVEESLYGTQIFPAPLSTSIALSDPWCRDHFVDAQYVDQVRERLSLDEDTMLLTEDIEEDICNFDLQPNNEPALGVEVNGLSQSSLYLEMVDWNKGQEHDVDIIRGVQNDNTREEQRMMCMMSEAEKQFTMTILRQVKVLEARLAVAEMEVVEYKVEMEHLQVNNMQASIETPLDGDEELQSLRAECEVQQEEIRLLMEQVLTPEAELERELLFQETIDRNNFLEDCLKKAERRLIRAKSWREEMLKLREAEKVRECSLLETQARIARLEDEGATLRRALSQVQPLQHFVLEESESTTGDAKPEVLAELQDSELQLSFGRSSIKRDGVTTPLSGKCITQLSPSTPSSHSRGLCPRPPRPVLGEVNRNSLKLMQPSLLKDPKNPKRYQHEVAKGTALDLSNKENESGFMILFQGTN